ncbi:MAG: hypothetical protein IV100_15430 [Myxococcales bacterium]|nr:hypothetical protein [Myxococcales bacterium]
MKTAAAILVGVSVTTAAVAETPAFEEVWNGDRGPQFPVDMGSPCTWGSDCLESVCILTPTGGACSRRCIDACPSGWSCVSAATEDSSALDVVCVLDGLVGILAPYGRPAAPDVVDEEEPGDTDDLAEPPVDVTEPALESEPIMADAAAESVSEVSEGGDLDASHRSARAAPSGGCRAAPSVEPPWVYVAPFIWALVVTRRRIRGRGLAE